MPLELILALLALVVAVFALAFTLGLRTGQRRLTDDVQEVQGEVRTMHGSVEQLTGQMGAAPSGELEGICGQLKAMDGRIGDLDGQLHALTEAPLISRALEHPRKIALVINPIKRNADQVRLQVAAAVRNAGLPEVTVYETTAEDPGQQMAKDALADGADVVIAAGGDGTVRFVAQELAGTDSALGLIPLGTGNLLARNLKMPIENLAACINTAVHGSTRRIDAVDIRLERQDGESVSNTFLVIAGAGIDAEVMSDTREDLKEKAGWLAYGEAGVRHLPGHRKDITLSLDGGAPQRRKVRSIMIANCGELTGGLDFIPEARLDDGLLDVVILSPRNAFDWLRIAAKAALKINRTIPIMETHQATRVRVQLDEPMISQLDGDATGDVVAIDARIRPDALKVQTPAAAVPDSLAAPAMTEDDAEVVKD
ncbi:diacylglycerol/lipid kinase family protein [Micrococcus terreus]|uniref:diacylglycerol/lipid kinase family protein n=1 Tax=Micrococcus terreus TaxID=574650 RepID=UPI0023F62852|nr:diacylglycerol kinase family protein [Micrococcus terreus]